MFSIIEIEKGAKTCEASRKENRGMIHNILSIQGLNVLASQRS